MASDITERVNDFITMDDEGRTCEAIPDTACRQAPQNFVLNALNGSATKLAEKLASPGLVLPWLFSAIGAPVALAGLLVPVKEAGSLLPQLAVAGSIRAYPKCKWFWAAAGSTQAVLLALIIPTAIWFSPVFAGWITVALLALFSVASDVGSVAFKDVGRSAGRRSTAIRCGQQYAHRSGYALWRRTGADCLLIWNSIRNRRIDHSCPYCRRSVPSAPGSP